VVDAGHTPLSVTVTSTAIDHRTGAAAGSQLFSRGAVEAGTILQGYIVGAADALGVLAKSLVDHDRLELGGRTSVRGSATVTVAAVEPPPVPGGPRVVLTTTSPAFLLDDAGRPSLDLEAELRRLGYQGAVEGRVWSRPVTEATGGFHAASRLPKPADAGIAAGSTVVLLPEPQDVPVLARIVGRGIGVRRPEGFGWVRFAHEPWQPPEPQQQTHDPVDAADGQSPGGFAMLYRSLHEARLTGAQTTWLARRLVDVGDTAADVAAALTEPGAGQLTGVQRDRARAALGEPPETRRRLADALDEAGPR
jgi:CRISPR-associated protein Csx10